jgi:hypothetical protein
VVSLEKLSEWDLDFVLDFVVETVAFQRQDREAVKDIVRDKADLIDVMLDDGRVFRWVVGNG